MGRFPFLSALLLLAGAMPAAAQVRVVVDGRPQEIPAGVVRTIAYEPGGRQTITDRPWAGQAMPGAATITTTETTDEDERGHVLHTTIVTRIEPIATVAYAAPVPPPFYSAAPRPMPQLALDTAAFETPAQGDAPPQVLRIRRDPYTGHFIAAIRINGVKVQAIIDTGAQQTVLSARDARATGAAKDVMRSTPMAGIGGMTMVDVTRVRSMEVGGQELGGFTACIGQDGIPYTLLGQTEIARLGRIVIEDGTMTIVPRGMQVAAR